MNAILQTCGRWWRTLLFAAWIWTLTGILHHRIYTAFLRPEFGFILAAGAFTLLGFLVTGMTDTRRRALSLAQAVNALILLLPLAFLANARGAALDASAFSRRTVGLPTLANAKTKAKSAAPALSQPQSQTAVDDRPAEFTASRNADAQTATPAANVPEPARAAELHADTITTPLLIDPDEDPNAGATAPAAASQPAAAATPAPKTTAPLPTPAPAAAPIPTGPAKELTILDLYGNADLYVGKRVAVEGMIYANEEAKTDFGKNALVVFRFVITCCAADATPLAVIADAAGQPELPDNTWVRAEGVFALKEVEGRRVPLLLNATLKKVPAPKQTYLY